ncbi:MAG: site-2 protease family protein [Bacilli bacterium]|nr:site-2 protease family protein [Bacilli bacterium]
MGAFFSFFVLTYLVVIHELGHFLSAKIMGIPVNKICVYPFGGISKVDSRINISLKKELIILIAGPLMQMIGYVLLCPFISNNLELNLFTTYNFSLLIFNLLPIYPLDGGKILNSLLAFKFSYLKSIDLSIKISVIIVIVLFIASIIINTNLNVLFMLSFLLYKIKETGDNKNVYFNKMLLERYLYRIRFPKVKIVSNEKSFRRDYRHLIRHQDRYYSEREYLNKRFH